MANKKCEASTTYLRYWCGGMRTLIIPSSLSSFYMQRHFSARPPHHYHLALMVGEIMSKKNWKKNLTKRGGS